MLVKWQRRQAQASRRAGGMATNECERMQAGPWTSNTKTGPRPQAITPSRGQKAKKQRSSKQDVGQEGFHGDVPAAPAPERHHEGSVAQLYQADAWCRWVHERGGEFLQL